MSLLQYVNEEIDERRGMEYLRMCSSRDVFHSVLAHTWVGVEKAKRVHTRGELVMDMSFELVHTFPNNKRIVRVRMVASPPNRSKLEQHNFSTFLVALCPEGCVVGVYKDSLSING
ncbi:hypothetical protein [Burkholderia phage FLC9]|nr:hypothetical protein [Burkholderia phage FLC9]